MKVIHVWKRQKCMERCVDGSGDSILTEGRERVVTDHLILVRFTPVNRLELLQAIQVEQCESGIPDGSQIHSASLDREHTNGPPCKRVRKLDLRAGVAAAKIRNAQIRSQQIRAVSQQRDLISGQAFCFSLIPEILQVCHFANLRHR